MKNHQSNVSPLVIGGVNVKPYSSVNELLTDVFSADGHILPGSAVAVNPEKILKSMHDQEVQRIINTATVAYADGIGVVKALQQKTNRPVARIAGVELWYEILMRSSQYNSKVLLVGAKEEVVKCCVDMLVDKGVNVVGHINGYFEGINSVTTIMEVNKPDIVIVAQGSPKQEKLIDLLVKKYPDTFYMGVGGSFDVLAGHTKRAPKFWIKLNLEWLYRLLSEPKRIFRQAKLLKFLYLYLMKRL